MITPVIEEHGLPGLPTPDDTGTPAPAPDPGPGAKPGASGDNQPAIWETEPEPRQLALIPDPDAWEADRPAPAGSSTRGGRLARRKRRAAAPPPDQLSLF